MDDRLPLLYCQRRLLLVWLLGSLPPLCILLIQTLNNYYEGADAEAWGWLLPVIMPTLSLVLGTYTAITRGTRLSKRTAERFFFRVTLIISVFYLLIITTTLLSLQFFSPAPIDTLRKTNYLLGPLQGLVAGCLGAFFVSSKAEKN
jgi:hypothetical protein